MHKSPDPFERDLKREDEIENSRTAPRDPELAADWALKHELAGFGAADLPGRARKRALQAASGAPRGPWLLAVAAVMLAAVVVALVLQSPSPSQSSTSSQASLAVAPSARDLADLKLALDTINRSSKRAVLIAGREVQQSLAAPDLGLAELPYAGYIQPYFERRDRS